MNISLPNSIKFKREYIFERILRRKTDQVIAVYKSAGKSYCIKFCTSELALKNVKEKKALKTLNDIGKRYRIALPNEVLIAATIVEHIDGNGKNEYYILITEYLQHIPLPLE